LLHSDIEERDLPKEVAVEVTLGDEFSQREEVRCKNGDSS
jgi:hypothetical protein